MVVAEEALALDGMRFRLFAILILVGLSIDG
jgi:hypothetical protein